MRMVSVSCQLSSVAVAYPGVLELESARIDCVDVVDVVAGSTGNLLKMNSDRTGPVIDSPLLWCAMGADIVIRDTPGGDTRSACQPAHTSVNPWPSRNPSP